MRFLVISNLVFSLGNLSFGFYHLISVFCLVSSVIYLLFFGVNSLSSFLSGTLNKLVMSSTIKYNAGT